MLLSQLTPWPWLMPQPEELSDEIVGAVPAAGARQTLVALLKAKRCPPEFDQLRQHHAVVEENIRQTAGMTFTNPADKKQRELHWFTLDAMLKAQMEQMLRRVEVSVEDEEWLMLRWFKLHLRLDQPKERRLDGRKVNGGIVEAKPGARADALG